MSLSANDALREVQEHVPTTSKSDSGIFEQTPRGRPLDADLLSSVFKHFVSACSIKDTLRLQSLHPLAARATRIELSRHSHLRIAVHEPRRFKIVGMQKEPLPQPMPHILIQGSVMESLEEAVELVKFLLASCKCISKLSLIVEDLDGETAERLVKPLIGAENVQLSVLHVQRKEGGRPLEAVSQLILDNTETLRILGRIGICEAAASFSSTLHLERLSLMTFDLHAEATTGNLFEKLLSIKISGATFSHLSYTSFVGFDPTEERVQNFLDECGVSSLRLTMMRGPSVPPKSDYMIGKVRKITHLELGEVVDRPNIVNRLVVHDKLFKKVFPNVDHITYFQRW